MVGKRKRCPAVEAVPIRPEAVDNKLVPCGHSSHKADTQACRGCNYALCSARNGGCHVPYRYPCQGPATRQYCRSLRLKQAPL